MEKRQPMPYAVGNEDSEDDLFSVVSTTECTGLIPAAPSGTAEVESYQELYDVPLSSAKNEGRKGKQPPNPQA